MEIISSMYFYTLRGILMEMVTFPWRQSELFGNCTAGVCVYVYMCMPRLYVYMCMPRSP